MATNGAKHTCAYVHEGCPEQNAYKCFHNRNISTRFLIDFNRATTKPNQTIFFLKPNQIKWIARATISYQTKWGPKQNRNCSTQFTPKPLAAWGALLVQLLNFFCDARKHMHMEGRTRKHSRRGGREWTGSRMDEDIRPPSTLGQIRECVLMDLRNTRNCHAWRENANESGYANKSLVHGIMFHTWPGSDHQNQLYQSEVYVDVVCKLRPRHRWCWCTMSQVPWL